MILVDTSVWVDHLRQGDDALSAHLDANRILSHPHVIGELALGRLAHRTVILASLAALPMAGPAMDSEVLYLIEAGGLIGTGIGYVDAHLLTAVRLTPGGRLWTRDGRLRDVAETLGVAWTEGDGG